MKNPYHVTKTKREIAEAKAAKEKALEEAIVAARKCLEHKSFQEYKKKYLQARDTTIELLLELRMTDPVQYAFCVQSQIEKLRSLGTFLYDVQNNARSK